MSKRRTHWVEKPDYVAFDPEDGRIVALSIGKISMSGEGWKAAMAEADANLERRRAALEREHGTIADDEAAPSEREAVEEHLAELERRRKDDD